MNNLGTLVSMQLRAKYNIHGSKFTIDSFFKLIYVFIKLLAIFFIAYLLFFVCIKFRIFSIQVFVPSNILLVFYVGFFFINLVTSTVNIIETLYLASDNKVLLSLPCKPQVVFLSKLIVCYIQELKTTYMTLLPIFLAYITINGQGISFYFSTILGMVVLVLLQTAICGLISIPVYYFIKLFKKFYWLQVILMVFIFVLIAGVLIYLTRAIPNDFNFSLIAKWGEYSNKVREFLKDFRQLFLFIAIPFEMLVGKLTDIVSIYPSYYWIFVLIIIALLIILNVIAYFLQQFFFFKLVGSNDGPPSLKVKVGANSPNGTFTTSFKITSLIYIRQPTMFFTNFAFTLLLPFVLLFFNRIYLTMDLREAGYQIILSFNIFFILLIISSNNVSFASMFSQQGAFATQFKIEPINFYSYTLGKLLFPIIITFISICFSILVIGASWFNIIFIGVLIICLIMAHLMYCIELDISNPQYKYYENGVHKNVDPNKVTAYIFSLLMSFVTGGFILFLYQIGDVNIAFKLMLVGILILLYRIFVFKRKINVFFRSF
ncbi:MAG: hypothetical protein LBM99_06625 [Bacillales bacterium]|jgi:hypothetical protein|nr:hypothetical protein [Bacillales bacterium]